MENSASTTAAGSAFFFPGAILCRRPSSNQAKGSVKKLGLNFLSCVGKQREEWRATNVRAGAEFCCKRHCQSGSIRNSAYVSDNFDVTSSRKIRKPNRWELKILLSCERVGWHSSHTRFSSQMSTSEIQGSQVISNTLFEDPRRSFGAEKSDPAFEVGG